jgi:hypothetical protein
MTIDIQDAESTVSTRNRGARSDIATPPRTRRIPRELAFWTGLAVVPAAIGVGVSALTGSRRAGVIAGSAAAVGFATVRWQLQRLFTDEPDYVVEQRIGPLEIRRYLPQVAARTQLDVTSFDRALDEGFRRLAGYIFGGNRAREKLAMTSPVTSRTSGKDRKGEKLAMTVPVITSSETEGHEVSFVMPPGRTRDSLPQPTDDRVELVELPARRVAVMRYRGRYRDAVVDEHKRELERRVEEANLAARGAPMFAGFDPPWTLPLLRRNELWLELA